jgi:hypothetical protein
MSFNKTVLFGLIITMALGREQNHQSKLCDICMEVQSSLFNFGQNHLEAFLSISSKICQIKSTKSICEYFVKNFGSSLFMNKKQFIESTNYLCSNILKLCASEFQNFDVQTFKKELYELFPKNSKTNNIFSRRSIAKNSFKVLVINDIHLQSDYQYKAKVNCGLPGGCCSSVQGQSDNPQNQAKYWGTPNAPCDAPDYLFYKTVDFIQKNIEKPDFIFMLGDNTGHNYFTANPQLLVDTSKIIINTLKENFADVPIVPVLGNHECHHVDYFDFSDKSNFVVKNIYPLFESVVAKDKIVDLIDNGFFSQEYPDFNIKVISLNSQINDAFNIANMSFSSFYENFLNKLAADLFESEKKSQRVIVISHIALSDYFAVDEINQCLLFILERFRNIIITFLSGHTHNDQIRFIRDSNGEIFQTNFISPSLTTFSSYNPSFRVYDFQNGVLNDYTQYKFDIDLYNAKADQGDFDFKYDVAYRFKEEYKIENWDMSQMEIFYQRLSNEQPDWISKYVRNYYCSNKEIDNEDKIKIVVCQLTDNLQDIFACMNQNKEGSQQVEFVLLFRRLFLRPLLVKSDSVV